MSFVLGVVIFVLALLVSVMLHEFGHFVTAKKFHMKVTQFFVGFGQTLFSRQRGETEYGVKALPLGGFVKITGMTALEEVDPADEARSFRRQPGWQRAIVLVAGSFMHFALAFVLLFILAVGIGVPNSTTVGVDQQVPAGQYAQGTGHEYLRAGRRRLPGRAGRVPGRRQGHVHRGPPGQQLDAARRRDPGPARRPADARRGGPGRAPGDPAGHARRDWRAARAPTWASSAQLFQRVGPVSGVAYAGSDLRRGHGLVGAGGVQAARRRCPTCSRTDRAQDRGRRRQQHLRRRR